MLTNQCFNFVCFINPTVMSKTEDSIQEDYRPSLRLCDVERPLKGSCGFHLSRTQWDPYPWISGVEGGSAAEAAGLTPGDCVLEVNGEDVLGQRICQVADKVREKQNVVSLLLWNAGSDPQSGSNITGHGPTPLSLQRLSTCLQAVFQLLECPVCLDAVYPPASQCCNGHMLCARCRSRADKCPVCRVPLGTRGRCLLADKLHVLLTGTFTQQTTVPDTVKPSLRPYIQLQSRLPLQIKAASVENISSLENHVSNPIKMRSISIGEIPNRIPEAVKQSTNSDLYNCPYGFECNIMIPLSHLSSHLQEHEGPLVQYFLKTQSKTSLRIPFLKKSSGLISLTTEDCLVYYVHIMDDEVLWLWLAGDESIARRRRVKVTLGQEKDNTTYIGNVFSLITPWHDIMRHQRCVRFGKQQHLNEVHLEIMQVDPTCEM